MKLAKYLFFGLAGLALTACSDDPHGISTKHPANEPSNTDDIPENVVSPKASFSLTSERASVSNASDGKVSLDNVTTYQEIESFGASDCWLPNTIGQYWGGNRQQLARWLFSSNITGGNPAGIGLTQWRVNLGAGTANDPNGGGIEEASINNRAESFLTTSGTYDWTRAAGQRYFMEQAKSMNPDMQFVLFSNSPLIQFTKNGLGHSDAGYKNNLKDDCYGAFAEYMAEVAAHFTDLGYNISHISPVNEPQYQWEGTNQEGCFWTNDQVAQLARELDAKLTAKGLDTKISLGETCHWEAAHSGNDNSENTIKRFFTPSSSAYVGNLKHVAKHLSAHSYWTFGTWDGMRTSRSKAHQAAQQVGIGLWQTEFSMLDAAPQDIPDLYSQSEFDIAQFLSRVIHNDLTVANVSSWSYWTAMSVERYDQKNRFMLIKTTAAGGNYDNDFTQEGTVEATPNLWVLGNYSLFVRPGYKRIGITYNETKDFFMSGYIAPDASKMVLVVTNYDKQTGKTIDVPTPAGTRGIARYTTSEKKNLQQDWFNVNDKVFVEPGSVTTIVYYL